MHSLTSFSVHAPASSANLGPGFDCLGLALDRWLRVDVSPTLETGIRAIGDADLLGGGDLVTEAMHVTAQRLGIKLPGCDIQVSSDIPVARGLGSSAAAIVAGMRAALELAGVGPNDALMNDIGGQMEGHADNISASVMGGVTASTLTSDGYVAVSLASELPWTPVLFIPDSHSMTHEARGVLPGAVPLADAAANIGRAVLLAHAISIGRADLLREAMIDRLHQPYRACIFPHLDSTIAGALAAGAHGASLSGAGPTVLALCDFERAEAVAAAMAGVGAANGVRSIVEVSSVVRRGCWVER